MNEWNTYLRRLNNGKIMSTPFNILHILKNDSLLAGRFGIDERGNWVITGDLPWRQYSELKRYFTETDMGCLCWYLEKTYGVHRGARKAFKLLMLKTI